jgi:hypothetical protein
MPVPTSRVEEFTFTIGSGVAEKEASKQAIRFNPGTVIRYELRIPDGPCGFAGVRINAFGTQLVPNNKGAWIISNNDKIVDEPGDWPNSGHLEWEGYNTDTNPHTMVLRLFIAESVEPAAIINRSSSEPLPIAPGGGVEVSETPAPPAPTPPPEAPPGEEPPPTGEKPSEPAPEAGEPPAPAPGEVPVEGEAQTPPPPPVEGEAPAPAPSLAPPPEAPEGEGSPPISPNVPGAAPAAAPKRKKHRPTNAQIDAYRKAHHGKDGTLKQVEAWLASKHKRKPAPGKATTPGKRTPPVKGKKSSVTRRTPPAAPAAKAATRRTPPAHHASPKPAPKRTPAPKPVTHHSPPPPPPRRTPPPPPPPPPKRSPAPPAPKRKHK